ncbi:MAG: hypothetical protein E6G44_10610 [Actinobacteria bacterium]|nr:MAG: hypothetical protein E6G44_10610 [Actinomycetota bacterium]
MPRRTFDTILSLVGVMLTAVLLVAGVLAFWGYSFANGKVNDQLVAQKIYFPASGSEAITSLPAADRPFIAKYAGQQLVTGAQAQAYADHFIAVHLKGVADGKTYAEVSTLARANPDDHALQGQVQTLFRGETLRGLLLNAYAFWKLGQLALIGSVAAFSLAIAMFVLTILGFWHLLKVPTEEQIFASIPKAERISA